MKSLIPLVLLLAAASTGCMTTSLERHTVNQSVSAASFRYETALHALAMVADEPATLPSYAMLSGGTASITDTGMANFATTWSGAPFIFASQALTFTGTRSPQQLWTVSPVADYTQLDAMRWACYWVLNGQDPRTLADIPILADPEDPKNAIPDSAPGNHPHFGVAGRLAALPRGWLHRGQVGDIPKDARFKAHCGSSWVWVMPDGMEGLAGFTLVLQDIATLNVAPSDNSPPADQTPPLLVTLWSVQPTVPRPSTVTIAFKRDRNAVILPTPTEVTVGQSVIWLNGDSDGKTSHSATSTINGLFDTTPLSPGKSSKPILFDDAMFMNAGGYSPNNLDSEKIEIEYSDKGSGADEASRVKAKIRLARNSYTGVYSTTLVFREDRVVRPCFAAEVQKKINEQMKKNPTDPVDITYEQWMEWTFPYQGQRTAVKPGAPQAIQVTVPSTRLKTPSALVPELNPALGRLGSAREFPTEQRPPRKDPLPESGQPAKLPTGP